MGVTKRININSGVYFHTHRTFSSYNNYLIVAYSKQYPKQVNFLAPCTDLFSLSLCAVYNRYVYNQYTSRVKAHAHTHQVHVDV